ncbi:MAG: hypothetical protein RTV72_17255, partial [Candidatus Thorarchaeota archaeon]
MSEDRFSSASIQQLLSIIFILNLICPIFLQTTSMNYVVEPMTEEIENVQMDDTFSSFDEYNRLNSYYPSDFVETEVNTSDKQNALSTDANIPIPNPIIWGPLWNVSIGGDGDQFTHSIIEVDNGDFVLSGSTNTTTTEYRDVWIASVDHSGNLLWNRSFPGPGYEQGNDIIECSSGGYLVATGGIMKLDENGYHLWNRIYGDGLIGSICELANGDFLLIGS